MRSSGSTAPSEGEAFKPLLPFRCSTLVEAAARAALDAGCRLLLVLGHRGDEIAAAFEAEGYRELRGEGRLRLVANPRWEEGLIGSIQSALPLLRSDAFFIAHADMPFVESGHYAALSAARSSAMLEAGSGAAAECGRGPAAPFAERAFAASCGGSRGHPVLLPASWAAEIAALPPGEGLRGFLAGRPVELVETGPGALRDIDTPGDYEDALRPCREGGR